MDGAVLTEEQRQALELVSGAMAGGRRVMTDRVYRGIIFVCGLMLLGFGLWFLWNGLGFLHGAHPAPRTM